MSFSASFLSLSFRTRKKESKKTRKETKKKLEKEKKEGK
jgi:hypothetical protein